LGFFYQKKR